MTGRLPSEGLLVGVSERSERVSTPGDDWLRGVDSNHDSRLQRPLSYHWTTPKSSDCFITCNAKSLQRLVSSGIPALRPKSTRFGPAASPLSFASVCVPPPVEAAIVPRHAVCSIRTVMIDLPVKAEVAFRLLIQEVRDFAIFTLSEAGAIESWNIGAELIFGYSASEILGRDADILFTAEDRATGRPHQELANARANGRADDTRWHVRRDGTRFFADGVTTALRDEAGVAVGFAKIARDITERYRTEQRLAAQLALTNLLHDDQPFSVMARRFMQTLCETLGWDLGILWQAESGRTIRCADVWHGPDTQESVARPFCEHVPDSGGTSLPERVISSGQPLWISDFRGDVFSQRPEIAAAGMASAFAFPITHGGRVTGVMEFFSRVQREPDQALMPVMSLIGAQIGDYIDRRHTAQALRQSEERYRVVSETAQDAIFTIDSSSRILFCNRAAEKLFGYSRDEFVGKTIDLIVPPSLRESHRRGLARYLLSGEKTIPWTGMELPALRKDGSQIPVEISFGVWSEGEETIFTGFARDISERNRVQRELQESLEHEQQARADAEASRQQLERRAEEESAFRHLASALTGAVEMTEVLYEITNRATLVTRADGVYVERIIGPERMVEVVSSFGRGTPVRGTRVGYPGSMTEEIIEGRVPVILADMKSFGREMAPYLLKTCENCEVLVTPLIADNEPLGALVLLNGGQSGRHFLEPDILRARTLGDLASLALRRVRLMEQEREAKEQAEAAVRVRDETLGIVSHDLRNPLTRIALSADLLVDSRPEEQAELIETIRNAARQSQRLIQDLLDVARMEAGALSVDKKTFDVKELVSEVRDTHQTIAAQRNQQILCSVHGEFALLCADRDRLLQVFGNLIGNAMKFTPAGGTITVEASSSHAGKEVLFRVRDNGPGIPGSDLKNVFSPYWQARKTAHMGAGLGLSIVRGIVEAHGGHVWAENGPGGGAMFTFTIPA
jgi:PAS domain S-box-containing protein